MDNQIRGNIILGFKNINFKNISIIKIEDNSIIFESPIDNVIEKHSISNLKDIKFNRRLTMNKNKNNGISAELNFYSDMLVATGHYFESIGASDAADMAEINSHYRIGNTYEVDMVLNIDGEDRNIKIETSKKPSKFIEYIKSKIQ